MCAINPKHHFRVTLDLYTSQSITKEQFEKQILVKLLEAEQLVNADGSVRCHVNLVRHIKPFNKRAAGHARRMARRFKQESRSNV